jgi:hypothetical protein
LQVGAQLAHGAGVQLRDAGLAHAEQNADFLEEHALEVVHRDDEPLAVGQRGDGPLEASARVVRLGLLGRALRLVVEEGRGLLARRHVVDAHDRRRRAGRLAFAARDGPAGAAREPVLLPEGVDDGAANANTRVPLEGRAFAAAVLAQRVHQAEYAGRHEIVAADVGGQLPQEAPHRLMHQGQVRLDGFARNRGRRGRRRHDRRLEGRQRGGRHEREAGGGVRKRGRRERRGGAHGQGLRRWRRPVLQPSGQRQKWPF